MKKQQVPKDKGELSFFHKTPRTELEKWIASVVPKINKAYGIGNVTVCYSTDIDEEPFQSEDGEGIFRIKYSKSYKTAYIGIVRGADEMWRKKEMEMLFHAVTHEIAHILTEDLANIASSRFVSRKEIINVTEEVTESVAQIGRELLKTQHPELFKF